MTPDSAVMYIALVGIVSVGILFMLEVRRWRDVRRLITRGQRILRTILIVLIELLFLMILVGPRLLMHSGKLNQLLYWSACLLVGLIVMVVALIDLRAVMRGYAALNRQVFGGLRGDDKKEDE